MLLKPSLKDWALTLPFSGLAYIFHTFKYETNKT